MTAKVMAASCAEEREPVLEVWTRRTPRSSSPRATRRALRARGRNRPSTSVSFSFITFSPASRQSTRGAQSADHHQALDERPARIRVQSREQSDAEGEREARAGAEEPH